MALFDGAYDDIESLKGEISEMRRSLTSSYRHQGSIFSRNSSASIRYDEESALQWAAIERLPTYDRIRSSLFDVIEVSSETKKTTTTGGGKRVVDVRNLGALERHVFIEKLIKHIEHDNLRLLKKITNRMNNVGMKLPTLEVRYKDLHVEAEVEVVNGKPLPTLWNSAKRILLSLSGLSWLMPQLSKIKIIDGVSGVIKPGRMTLLLGPPGCGKSSLLKALSGNLDKSLMVNGEIIYNGYKLNEFVPQKTSAYISQYDVHMPELTVRETLDFSTRFQGVGTRTAIMKELSRREKEAGLLPDPDIDTYMKAISVEGQTTTLQTDYILKILGLDICADIAVGNAMKRGISGGQKKRLTIGEMIVGPTRALFMDEISNGLDSSTTYQIVACLQHLAHITDATLLVALLQPAPETFDLFDDVILMDEGKIVYHGSRDEVLNFFESCGFRCPERKGIADFLQEVISRSDQAQYWYGSRETYTYHSVTMFSKKFMESTSGEKLTRQLSMPLENRDSNDDAIKFSVYSQPKWSIFKTCLSREFLLMKRNSFVYIFKAMQLLILASITMTVFIRTRMDKIDLVHANYYAGAIFFTLVIFLVDGFPELSMTLARLDVFFKQRNFYFYPAWAYAIPSSLLKVPFSLLPAFVWTSLSYFVIGFTPDAGRFFRQLILLFCIHLSSTSGFRFLASITRTAANAQASGVFFIILSMVFSGFVIPKPSMPKWLKWGFWVSQVFYGEIGLSVNEFHSPRWQKMFSTNTTIGQQILQTRGLNFRGIYFWISVAALFGFAVLFNMLFTLAITFLPPPGGRVVISSEKVSEMKRIRNESDDSTNKPNHELLTINATEPLKAKVILPFEPLTVVFMDLQYYVDAPSAMKEHGFDGNKLQILCDVTGTFRPGVLTALMGVSGAGKTSLLDVLAGRKTGGYIEGEIKIGGYPKVQKTFARVSGYCEQNDIHTSQITVKESVIFSAWLRLDPTIDSETRSNFVTEVLETIELDKVKDALVGVAGVTGLSPEQRKRLTLAVELVANPSIIFLDEPTTGLDARSAAIVMRAVKKVAETGRTIVCTIHQPSIDIFDAFDEVLLLKSGGRVIYFGPLGLHSCNVIEYFESIANVPKIEKNYNPATWMLEITSRSSEAELAVDFAEIYQHSVLHQKNKELAKEFSSPPSESKDLTFRSEFSQNGWGQFKACLWKQHWSYWRSPSYNLVRLANMLIASLVFGALFWKQGQKLENQQSLFTVFGSMFSTVFFSGINNCASVLPYISAERNVVYRERFSGMYAAWAYALAQVIVEIPYLFLQVVLNTVITYPMIGYYGSAYKVFWYMYSMFCTLLYFNYLGMMLVSITPTFLVAAILQSAFYVLLNLFSGFIVPRPQIPKWWLWLYYLTPTSWSLNGMLTSQYGDIHRQVGVFGGEKEVAVFLKDYFGFHHDRLPVVGFILILYPIFFASVFAFCIKNFNFQNR